MGTIAGIGGRMGLDIGANRCQLFRSQSPAIGQVARDAPNLPHQFLSSWKEFSVIAGSPRTRHFRADVASAANAVNARQYWQDLPFKQTIYHS